MSGYILEVELIDIEPTFGTSWGRLGKEFLRQALLRSMGWDELSCGWRGVSDDGWGERWTTIFISAFQSNAYVTIFILSNVWIHSIYHRLHVHVPLDLSYQYQSPLLKRKYYLQRKQREWTYFTLSVVSSPIRFMVFRRVGVQSPRMYNY